MISEVKYDMKEKLGDRWQCLLPVAFFVFARKVPENETG